jgi:hypothetical protein
MAKPRPKLPLVSEQMKAWSAALAAELENWPSVTTHPMFGFTAFYRGKRIFAVLPRTRGMEGPNSLAFKIPRPTSRLLTRLKNDPRIRTTVMPNTCWIAFELSSDSARKWRSTGWAKPMRERNLRPQTENSRS